MSKTDKDKPLWVQNAEHGHIDHDHRTGECIVSDDQHDRWPGWRHHYSKCKKRVRVEFTCTKDEPYAPDRFWRVRNGTSCWIVTRICPCPIPDSWKNEPHGCTGRYTRIGCIGHTRIEYDDTIPCSCDDLPPVATCTPSWEVGRYYTWGGVPSWYVTQTYHRPERARERTALRDYAREYNAYGELEDGDFDNRQARNSAKWTWW